MKKINCLVGAASAIALTACAPMPMAYQQPMAAPANAKVLHSYSVSVTDAKNQPMPNTKVLIELQSKGAQGETVNCDTDASGKCPGITYMVGSDPGFTYIKSYTSTARVTVDKDGYYKQTAVGTSDVGSTGGSNKGSTVNVKLIKPDDYFNASLQSGKSNQEVKESVKKFLDQIRLQSLLVETSVALEGIGAVDFKGKAYLQLKLESGNVYNSLKVNKYDMGKTIFDDSVRKILTPLNDLVVLPKSYTGFDILVIGQTKSFAEKYALPKKVEYRFIMPAAAVKKYKDKEISGQGLLDSSIILMDDERIDLKLQ